MQDVRSQAICTSGGGNGFFDNNGGGDRRLRPQQLHHNHNHNHQHHQQPLKCPRCDSLNTKFCYFNNYNLSQPRHFCKSCRRYWTKGGVLRNVPVGGGCRKSNRSPKLKTSSVDNRKSNSHSSSEASSLTVTAATPDATTSVSSSNSGSNLMNYPNSAAAFFEFPPMIDTSADGTGLNINSLVSSRNNDPLLLGFKFNESDFPEYRMMQNHEISGSILYNQNSDRQLQLLENPITSNELKLPEMNKAVVLETDLLGLNSNRTSNGAGDGDGAVELQWTAGEDEELFDQCYWTQWSGEANSMYLP